MNHLSFLTFFIYVISMFLAGIGIYEYMNPSRKSFINRAIYWGEVFLLGSILIVGEMLLLSMIGLYRAPYLWTAVGLNYLLFLNAGIRVKVFDQFKGIRWDFLLGLWVVSLVFFAFRNCYFLMDVDSHANYLYSHKLWLMTGSSLQGDAARNFLVFLPRFDAIPYGLGISIFGEDTLFPQLVNLHWRMIVLLLVFGYTSYRFGGYHALAASLFVMLNDHFFFSGANKSVIINAVLAAFLFAAAYNFWLSRLHRDSFRFVLAIIFAGQVMANKYQVVFALASLVLLGVAIQSSFVSYVKDILRNKKWLAVTAITYAITFLHYLKNFFITGIFTFPALAGKFHIFNWTPDSELAQYKVLGKPGLGLILKYLNYLFVWPGLNPAKYVIVLVSFLPLIILVVTLRNKLEKESVQELVFWLGLSVLCVIGLCLATFWDPRYYRYLIGILTFTAVLGVHYILSHCLNIKNGMFIGIFIIFLSLPGYKIIFAADDGPGRPSFQDNMDVLMNKLHFKDVVIEYYPKMPIALAGFENNRELAMKSAWDIGVGGITPLSAFLLPIRPQVGLWNTTLVKWESYNDPKLIVKDLKDYGIERIMRVEEEQFVFLTPEEYAREAVTYNRFPKGISYDYGFPKELAEIKY